MLSSSCLFSAASRLLCVADLRAGVRRVVRAICEAFTPRLHRAETLLTASRKSVCLCQGNYLLSCTEPHKVTAFTARVGLRVLPSAASRRQKTTDFLQAVSSSLTPSLPLDAGGSHYFLSRCHPLDVFLRPVAARCKQELGGIAAVAEEGVWVAGVGRWGVFLLRHPVTARAGGRGLL